MGPQAKEIGFAVVTFAFMGTAAAGWRGSLVGAAAGAVIGWTSAKEFAKKRAAEEAAARGARAALQNSADEAREDELRLVTNHLQASGIPAWRDAARELSDLKHREDMDPN